jgi:predicted nuclease of predicted toxin-antitoxin system
VRFKKPRLSFVLDEGVPNSVGRVLTDARHKVTYLNEGKHLPRGAKDELVCAFAIANDMILVAIDGDIKQIAKKFGVTNSQYGSLCLLKLSCKETDAAERVKVSLSLIEHEWHVGARNVGRRIFIEIMGNVIKSNR